MSRMIQIACASCGILFVFVLFGGILAAGWIPPIPPSENATEVAHYYATHANGIRTMAVMVMFGAGLTIPFAALMATHVRRMEGPFAPLFAVNLIAGGAGVVAIFMPAMLLGAAAYRPERMPELTQALNDLAWVPFIMNGPPAIAQAVSFGVAVLGDKSDRPAFPRWLGFYNFWVAFCFLPACILVYFKTGPFAWNGLLSFWLAATVFGTYFVIMGVMFIKAARVVESDPVPDPQRGELVAA
jgi:hypothetical protein